MSHPTSSLADTQASFRTHANYLRAFAHLGELGADESAPTALERLCRRASPALPQAVTPTGLSGSQSAEVFSCLNRAWGTELILNVSRRMAGEDELVRLTNSWGSVQAYYVAYGATQALIVAEGRARPTNHQSTQAQVEPLWVTRRSAVAPWSFAVTHPGSRGAGADGVLNGPGRLIPRGVHNLATCTRDNSWDLAALALRRTREKVVEAGLSRERSEKLKARKRLWREDCVARAAAGVAPRNEPRWPTRQNLTTVETSAIRGRVRPFTLLDYLYRLRIKANYEDARMFTEGPVAASESESVARDLVRLSSATLLVHELRVGRILGRSAMLAAVDSWLAQNSPPGRPMGLAVRRDLVAAFI